MSKQISGASAKNRNRLRRKRMAKETHMSRAEVAKLRVTRQYPRPWNAR